MTFLRRLCILLLCGITATSFAQSNNWTTDERQYYNTLKALSRQFENKRYDSSQREIVFKQLVYFDYVLNDTSATRMESRVKKFDSLFYGFTRFIDSIGLENIEAKPTRFFKSDSSFYKVFEQDDEFKNTLPLTLTYFDRRRPGQPLGLLLFEQKTHKLVSWILFNQGGYLYFFTFNLI